MRKRNRSLRSATTSRENCLESLSQTSYVSECARRHAVARESLRGPGGFSKNRRTKGSAESLVREAVQSAAT